MSTAVKIQPKTASARAAHLDAGAVRTVEELVSRLKQNPFAALDEAMTPRELVAQLALRQAITSALAELDRDRAWELAEPLS